MEVGWLSEEGNADLAPALVAGPADVQRLMQVADEMNDEAQRRLLVGEAGPGVLEHRGEMVERLKSIAFGRRSIIHDPVEVHVVPRNRRLLPELARRRAHFVGPVGGLGEALARTEYLL